MKIMRILSVVVGLGVVLLAALPAVAQEVWLDKTQFNPGDTIKVYFTAQPNFAPNAWIGIIPSNVPHGSETENDKFDLTYQYLKGKSSGELIFRAPQQAGSYDFRMHDTDNNGREVAHVTFTVGGQAEQTGGGALTLDKNTFGPGETIRLKFTAQPGFAANAWIGIIPSNVPHGNETENDKYDLTYQYLKNKPSGELIFRAPNQPGSYDFRMHDTDNNGQEVAHITFTVGGVSLLQLDKTSFKPGETIRLQFTAQPGFASNAWIGIIPSNVPHGNETENDKYDLTYQYLKNRPSGELIFRAPQQAGSYDFRMHNTDNNGREVDSLTFQVQ